MSTNVPPGGIPRLITIKELAVALRIDERSIWRLVSAGKIMPPLKIGGSARWREDEVAQWIKDRCPVPRPK